MTLRGEDIMQTEYTFTPQSACAIVEQEVPSDIFEETAAWQYLIDTGIAWRLQGFYERTAKRLIIDGVCTYTDRADERRQQ